MLGHDAPLEENTGLMGYGWPDLGAPVDSARDLRTRKAAIAWALAGDEAHPPSHNAVPCRGLYGT